VVTPRRHALRAARSGVPLALSLAVAGCQLVAGLTSFDLGQGSDAGADGALIDAADGATIAADAAPVDAGALDARARPDASEDTLAPSEDTSVPTDTLVSSEDTRVPSDGEADTGSAEDGSRPPDGARDAGDSSAPPDAGSGCDIGGTQYASGATNPAKACQSCQPRVSTSSWTNLATGTSCGAGAICADGVCAIGCYIDGTVYSVGASINPANSCQYCSPSVTTEAWTNFPDGTPCQGGVCAGGSCSSADCYIGDTLYTSGTANPSNSCQVCKPSVTPSAWSPEASGTACGSGKTCDGAGNCG
jgi:hypothetical protein